MQRTRGARGGACATPAPARRARALAAHAHAHAQRGVHRHDRRQRRQRRRGCGGGCGGGGGCGCVRAGVVVARAASAGAAAAAGASSGARPGSLAPADPALADPATFGRGLYSHADWSWAYVSAAFSGGAAAVRPRLRVDGEVPGELLGGTLWRNGPGRFERGGTAYAHMLDGDGLVYCVELDDRGGGARLRARFVATAEYLEEEEASEVCYRGTFGTPKPGGVAGNALDLRTKNLSNTNLIAWGERLLSLYEAGLPCAIDPETLECKTPEGDSLGGALGTPGAAFVSTGVLPAALERALGVGGWAFTAHPHIDPHSDRLCGWAWQSVPGQSKIRLRLLEWGRDWTLLATRDAELLDCQTAPHDFGVTESAYVFVQNRMDLSPLPFVAGVRGAGECLVSRPDLPVQVVVVPRDPALPVRAVNGPTKSFEIHTALAHDGPASGPGGAQGDGWQTVYSAGWDELAAGSFLGEWGASEPFDFELATALSPDFQNIPATLLWRYEVNAALGEVRRRVAPGAEGCCIDHPHVNPRFEGSAECRFVFASVSNELPRSGPPCGYVKVDVKAGTRAVWWAGNRTFCEEPVIVPKADGTEEDDVWLLGIACDHTVNDKGGESSLLILDGARLADGPVARVWLGERLPHGLHGCFTSARES